MHTARVLSFVTRSTMMKKLYVIGQLLYGSIFVNTSMILVSFHNFDIMPLCT